MAKNHVPDWLNNSLWSSRSPPPQQSLTPAKTSIDSEDMNRSTNSVVKSSVSTESSVNMPVPVPPPAVIRAEPRPVPPPSPKVEIIGPLNSSSSNCRSDGENGSSDSSTTTSGISSTEDISRQAQLSQELSRKIINLGEVRRLASQGIPDGPGIRAIVWKLLLGYLPTEKALWPTELAKKRPEYKQFKEELLMNPSEIARRLEKSASLENDGTGTDIEGKGVLSRSKVTQEEHPLSLGKSSIWNQFFQDTEIIEQIDRDVKRTHPDLHFFSGDTPSAKSNQARATLFGFIYKPQWIDQVYLLFPGCFEDYTHYICQTESWY
uniref:RabGAP/TBC domain-containing protein n=1 Tax=Solanum tuberosum TaxID=4113 RepID=M1BAC6_SOLTU